MLLENDIKAALVNKIINAYGHDDIVINEMVIGKGERRADLVLASKYLHAFEIKSDADTLVRLDGQLNSYSKRFEKSTLIITDHHLLNNIKADENIEIWNVKENRLGKICFKVLKRARRRNVARKDILCEFLSNIELNKILKKYFIGVSTNMLSRSEMVAMAECIPYLTLRNEVVDSVKKRYKEVYKQFLSKFDCLASSENIQSLSKAKLNRLELEEKYSWEGRSPNKIKRHIDFSRLLPQGDVPDGIPRHLIIPEV